MDSPGKLTGCENDLAQLVWPSKVKSSLWQRTIHKGFAPALSPHRNKLPSSWKYQWNPCVMGDFCAAEKHFFVETGFAFIFSLGMKMESKRPQNPMSPPGP